MRQSFDSGASAYGYAGEWADPTGLVNLRARYYAPAQGRFLTQDPFPGMLAQPATLQPYLYVVNNPVLLTDPSGEIAPLLLLGLAGGAIGGGIYGFGSQVVHNLNQGMCFWDALTTNISAGQIALYAGAGALIGSGIGLGSMGLQALVGYIATKSAVGIAITGGTALSADGDPTNEIRSGFNVVYQIVENGVTKYIGITNNPARRAAEHLRRGWRIEEVPGLGELSRADARAVEQVLIEFWGLVNLHNKINSIAPSNPIYTDAIKRGTEILKAIGFFTK